MPGWHAKTSELVQAGKLKVLGITQEQHPARTALFMQWHEMEWPVLLDSLNLLGCKSIPFTLLIDEHGIVRYQNPKDAELAAFMEAHYPKPEQTATPETNPTRSSPEGQLVWGGTAERNSAIESLTDRLKLSPNEATSHFRLGVAYRLRHDSAQAEKGDFEKAISSWKTALSIDPSQYIWRRRIQQYGPRLDKPYSFYDWVHQARKDITARGEIPHPLDAEPQDRPQH